ncbi:hypothetical protein FGIG_12489 [Fasciola gigantica]|uniref:Uncharacterized protein n=1 Tax=Fasciola gigantica TaxID=46835 RepID=A0A504YUF9_FASGI|nr:hypothetical protein FGIG_12489 [Fasciola gigantica]
MWSSEQEDTTQPTEISQPENRQAMREEKQYQYRSVLWNSLWMPLNLMSVSVAQSSQRHPPIPIPTKFNPVDDYRQWEGQIGRCLKHFPPDQQSDLLLSLLKGQAYDSVIDARVIPAIISESHIQRHQTCDGPPGLLLARQREFHDRKTQRPGESIFGIHHGSASSRRWERGGGNCCADGKWLKRNAIRTPRHLSALVSRSHLLSVSL